MRSSETIENLSQALVLVQAEIENPTKDTKGQVRGNPNYRYAGLPAILAMARPILARSGLALTQEAVGSSEGVGVITRIVHVSGEWLEMGPLLLPPQAGAQDVGSALTYACRYAVNAVLAISAEDDDGAAASRRHASGESTAKANTGQGSVTSPRDADGVRAAQDAASPENAAGVSTPPAVPEGAGSDQEVTIAYGEGATDTETDPAPSSHYLSKDDQALLRAEYGGQLAAIKAYKARFGDRITRLADITYEMRDQMMEVSA